MPRGIISESLEWMTKRRACSNDRCCRFSIRFQQFGTLHFGWPFLASRSRPLGALTSFLGGIMQSLTQVQSSSSCSSKCVLQRTMSLSPSYTGGNAASRPILSPRRAETLSLDSHTSTPKLEARLVSNGASAGVASSRAGILRRDRMSICSNASTAAGGLGEEFLPI